MPARSRHTAAGGNAALARPTRRQKEDLAMALRLLSRSAAALVAQQLGPAAQRLPSDWNPFASMAGVTPSHCVLELCIYLRKGCRLSVVIR